MITALVILICILTVLLILVVLVQNSKGGGLAGEFGGLGSNQLMGVKKTTDILEQITWGLGVAIMVLSLTSYVLIPKEQGGATINSANVDAAATKTLPGAAPQAPTQQQPATPAPAAPPQSGTTAK
ncbi:preprotein translocase subunit SecG [Tellurirhabdus rosea]|uniref:preprotein translocase subunit SecG n=1 Tax=Tellurirhabdus rosea TaxID=2674997 RepID=UPI0022583129|nr:preprotein translocase subunit SecG [Tellurirhabdus rosea]